MTVAACFISRAGGGLAITGARWFDLKGESPWLGLAPGKAIEDPVRAAEMLVEWIAVQAKASPGNPEVIIVLDSDGAGCGWITAESPQPEVVRAAVRDALGDSEEDTSPSLAWMGQWVGPSEVGSATSVQALADVTIPRQKSAKQTIRRQRLGIMSVPDAPIRLVLDALDGAGIRVRRVCTIWHALAAAQVEKTKPTTPAPTPTPPRIVADATTTTVDDVIASVLIQEPPGEILWTWSQGGALLCAGSIKLRESVDEPPAVEPAPGRANLRLIDTQDPDQPPGEPPTSVVEVGRSDIGRLATDWLGWSVQTGLAPQRISVAGASSITCNGLEFDLPDMLGVAAVAAGIGKAWPGVPVAAAVNDDPVATTLRRMIDVENLGTLLPAGPMAVDPRQSITTLSTRPGRASRKLHLWGGLALLAGGAAVAVLGVRAGRSARELAGQLDGIVATREEFFTQAKKYGAVITPATPEPVALLRSKVNEKLAQRRELREEDPLIAELARFLQASEGVQGLELRALSLNSGMLATAEFLAREDAGPTFLERIRATRTGAPRELRWDGRTIGVDGTRRRFNLSARMDDAPKNTPPLPPLPKPTPTPTPTTTPATPATPESTQGNPTPAPTAPVPAPTPVPETPAPETPPATPATPTSPEPAPTPAPEGTP